MTVAAALWLKAKLQLRAGKFADATNTMARAVEMMRTSPAYALLVKARNGRPRICPAKGEYWGFASSATGDLGGLSACARRLCSSTRCFVQGPALGRRCFCCGARPDGE